MHDHCFLLLPEKRSTTANGRACNNMVSNQFYAGHSSPVYDSVFSMTETVSTNRSHSETATISDHTICNTEVA